MPCRLTHSCHRILPLFLWAALSILSGSVRGEGQFREGDWPFRPLARPAIPEVTDTAWAANPIDRFVLRKLEDAGLRPNRAAEHLTLLRRVTFDLTGLPPSVAEQAAFLSDNSADAYRTVVDRLLVSPRFGERWAQHWLDVVRFAETDGFKSDRLKPNAWRYRDYVISAFNSDMPYDRFVRQQLAGDELEPDNTAALIATGCLRLCPDEDNAANLLQRRQELLDDITDTTGLAFLGLTFGCAQCHDHKFDPILQADYFRLQAFFAAMTERDDVPAASDDEVAKHREQLAQWEAATRDVRREIDELVNPVRAEADKSSLEKYEAAIQACYLTPAAERNPQQARIASMVERRMAFQFEDAMPNKLDKEQRARYDELQQRLAEFDALRPPALPLTMAVADLGAEAPPTHLLDGGNWRRPLEVIDPGFPEFLTSEAPTAIDLPAPEATTGRRSQLADWLTRPDHPLTSRVIVNRLWQHHFGQGIVATPNDFGLQGSPPTHPELLDWLAAELVENGWSLKHLHRLMVTSATYCQSSLIDRNNPAIGKASEVDSSNKLLWRARRQRLDGEAIRDAMLLVAGELNCRMFGESARPELPEGVSERYAWKPNELAADRNRRSIYVFVKRNMRFPLFEVFDQPDLHQSCGRRALTISAPQSLLMINSKFTRETARHWADQSIARCGDDTRAFIVQAYHEAFGRTPSPPEQREAEAFINAQASFLDDDAGGADDARRDAVADFCHALLNSNEFVTLD